MPRRVRGRGDRDRHARRLRLLGLRRQPHDLRRARVQPAARRLRRGRRGHAGRAEPLEHGKPRDARAGRDRLGRVADLRLPAPGRAARSRRGRPRAWPATAAGRAAARADGWPASILAGAATRTLGQPAWPWPTRTGRAGARSRPRARRPGPADAGALTDPRRPPRLALPAPTPRRALAARRGPARPAARPTRALAGRHVPARPGPRAGTPRHPTPPRRRAPPRRPKRRPRRLPVARSPTASATPPSGSAAELCATAPSTARRPARRRRAEDFVRGYYTALDAKRFDEAWASLSPAVRKSFGGLEKWRAGYAKTLSSRPRDVAVATEGHAVTVEHVLLARDRGCKPTRRFGVKWRLHRSSETWTVDGLTAAALGDPRC